MGTHKLRTSHIMVCPVISKSVEKIIKIEFVRHHPSNGKKKLIACDIFQPKNFVYYV